MTKKKLSDDTRLSQCAKSFGQRLRYLRLAERISQKDFAMELGGFRPDTISRIECGESTGMSLDLLTGLGQWAELRRVSVAWILTGAGSSNEVDHMDTGMGRGAESLMYKLFREWAANNKLDPAQEGAPRIAPPPVIAHLSARRESEARKVREASEEIEQQHKDERKAIERAYEQRNKHEVPKMQDKDGD